jgi:hypothetical protein
MSGRVGFWSYVHADDVAEGGRIKQLANHLCEQYALISGESIEIFVDHDALEWGDNWREHVDSSLASILFFIAVITPRYFLSVECRRELQEFTRGAERLGVRELVLPLVYVDVPTLREESPPDEAVALVKTYQWADWRELRFEDVTSRAYRRAVAALAQRLIDANQRVLAAEISAPRASDGALVPSETRGTLDVLAAGEEALTGMTETQGDLGSETEMVGNLVQQATDDIQRAEQQGTFADQLAVARRLAHDLSLPAERVLELANNYTTDLYKVDGATRTIIAKLLTEASGNPTKRAEWDEFADAIIRLADTTNRSAAITREFMDSLSQLESLSRELQPPIQKLRHGLTIFTEGASVINEWRRLVDEANIQTLRWS